jgi:hypothetical protein
VWGTKVKNEKFQLAMDIHKLIEYHFSNSRLKHIDVSKAYVPETGSREIVVSFDDIIQKQKQHMCCPRLLRLSNEDYYQQLANYLAIKPLLNDKVQLVVIDMRLPQMAFIDP